jgi:hypothetical protein
MVGGSSLALWRPAASATAPLKCPPAFQYGAIGGKENPGTAHTKDSRPTRSDIWIPADGAACQRISSIYLVSCDQIGIFK